MNLNHPLMHNNITKNDIENLTKFLKKNPILTSNKQVRKFEQEWSKWLGVKYSCFVNSGSSANLLSIKTIKEINKSKRHEIIVPALTWPSDIYSIYLMGFKPVIVDINLSTMSIGFDQIKKATNRNTLAVFITYAQGFSPLNDLILKFLNKRQIYLIEDVCESHGATFKNKKLGSLGIISNFSFYYAHHMSTIEGGIVSTNNSKVYNILRMARAHGMLRESDDKTYKRKIEKKNSKLNPKFIFTYPGFNFRNTEIGAILGLSQLKNLDKNNKKRNENFIYFIERLNKSLYYTDFDFRGMSNYALQLVLKKKSYNLRNKLENLMSKYKIEFRRGNAGGGNQVLQPYFSEIKNYKIIGNLNNANHIHNFGYYLGNYPSLSKSKINKICKVLNTLDG